MKNLLKTIITSRLKTILSILILVVLLGGLALATYLIQTQKSFDLRKKAAEIPTPPRAIKYNIVLVMADDLDVGSLEVLLRHGYMKNLKEEIIQKGTTFTNSFVTNSLCCPSRATLLTGQYSHNHNVKTNVQLAELFGLPSGGVTALDDSSTLATWLKNAGYRTGHVGKYLNGYGSFWWLNEQEPEQVDSPNTAPEKIAETWRYSEYAYAPVKPPGGATGTPERRLNFRALHPRYIPPGWDDWQATIDPTTYHMYGYKINDNGTIVQYGADYEDESNPENYQTDVLARRAVDFIYESEALDDNQPFFLGVMPLSPHVEEINLEWPPDWSDIWQLTVRPAPRHQILDQTGFKRSVVQLPLPKPASFNEQDVSDKPLWLQDRPLLTQEDIAKLERQYQDRLGSLLAVDDLIGTVVQSLKETGELENTILIFTSDNGFLYAEHRLSEKLFAYEETIRVPFYIRVPTLPGGRTLSQYIINNDWAPTIAELAGATPGIAVDGHSLVPLLSNPAGVPRWRRRFLVEHWQGLPKWLLKFEVPTYSALRTSSESFLTPEFLYVEYSKESQDRELYELRPDRFQLNNLFNRKGQVWKSQILKSWLGKLKTCKGNQCWLLETQ